MQVDADLPAIGSLLRTPIQRKFLVTYTKKRLAIRKA